MTWQFTLSSLKGTFQEAQTKRTQVRKPQPLQVDPYLNSYAMVRNSNNSAIYTPGSQ